MAGMRQLAQVGIHEGFAGLAPAPALESLPCSFIVPGRRTIELLGPFASLEREESTEITFQQLIDGAGRQFASPRCKTRILDVLINPPRRYRATRQPRRELVDSRCIRLPRATAQRVQRHPTTLHELLQLCQGYRRAALEARILAGFKGGGQFHGLDQSGQGWRGQFSWISG